MDVCYFEGEEEGERIGGGKSEKIYVSRKMRAKEVACSSGTVGKVNTNEVSSKHRVPSSTQRRWEM
jgi:hypothetical protein